MNFVSTRGSEVDSFLKAFNKGLAEDGGLFLPESFPNLSDRFDSLAELTYPELVAEFMHLFAPEISKDEWSALAKKSYSEFSAQDTVNLHQLRSTPSRDLYVLELFHGPTRAFKDFALQLVGSLYERESKVNNSTYTIVGATSGDTGSAAIYGVIQNPSVKIFIMYPDGKIAHEQELQITTTGSSNVFPIAIEGTFDDAQRIVKELFSDTAFSKQIHIAAVNSINIARILAQSVYYLYIYLKLRKGDQENLANQVDSVEENVLSGQMNKVRFIIPTGNFGNILSGWILNRMGIECDFVFATNENNVLDVLWKTGIYAKKGAVSTHAPSMDIQQASNFERMLYFMYGENPEKVKEILGTFNAESAVSIDLSLIPKNITSHSVSDLEIEQSIKDCFDKYGYVIDPHTACAYASVSDGESGVGSSSEIEYMDVILATASPAKFPEIVEKCTGQKPIDPAIEQLKERKKVYVKKEAKTEAIKGYIEECLGFKDMGCF
ncbi:MAG: threonine synthase [Candidatus Pacebacteria bacterium]|nr:threonine synthase [Candidatus Paceibacterota bacterium]